MQSPFVYNCLKYQKKQLFLLRFSKNNRAVFSLKADFFKLPYCFDENIYILCGVIKCQ